MIVVDASVAVKWFTDETGSDLARDLLDAMQGSLAVPDIFVVEVASALVRIANAGKMPEFAQEGLFRLLDLLDRRALILERTPPGLTIQAAHLAIDLRHPFKDCIYLALAMSMDRPLITADERFAAIAQSVWKEVTLLGA